MKNAPPFPNRSIRKVSITYSDGETINLMDDCRDVNIEISSDSPPTSGYPTGYNTVVVTTRLTVTAEKKHCETR